MAWSYSGDPSNSLKDELRFLIQDTDTKDQLLQDGEIKYLLTSCANSPLMAAIKACDQLIAKFSRMCDETVDKVSLSFSQKAKAYISLKKTLQETLSYTDCMPYAGGISVADKQANELDNDRVDPDFTKHMMENKGIAPWLVYPIGYLWP